MFYRKAYKARLINAIPYRLIFQHAHCVLPISVGQHYHSNEKLRATLTLINQHFRQCSIIIADTLQRHTIMLEADVGENEAITHAKLIGKEWLHDNLLHIDECLSIPYQFYYWDDWLKTNQYAQQREHTENLYHTVDELKKAVTLTINYFYERKKSFIKRNSIHFNKKIFDYIMEECSVMPLWVNEGFHFEVYPAKRTPAMAAIYDIVVKPTYPNLLRYLQVELRSKIVREIA